MWLEFLFFLKCHYELFDNLRDLVHVLSAEVSLTVFCLVSLEFLSVLGVVVLDVALLFGFVVVHVEGSAIDFDVSILGGTCLIWVFVADKSVGTLAV